MREFRFMGRDITVWNGHFLADADGGYHHVSKSLADVIVAAIDCEASFSAGNKPSWEHPTLPFTVVTGMARTLPQGLVEDDPLIGQNPPIYRLDDSFGRSTWWLLMASNVRAFFTPQDAMVWRNEAMVFGFSAADLGNFQSLTKEGY